MSVTDALAVPDAALQHVRTHELVTSVGVDPSIKLNSAYVSHLLVYVGVMDDINQWVVADLLVWGDKLAEETVGGRGSRAFWEERDKVWGQMLGVCKMSITKHTAYNMAACARSWPHARRRHTATLSFEHHRLLIGKEADEQDYWLEMAEAGEWSAHRLRRELAPPVDMTPSVRWTDERIWQEVTTMQLTPETVYQFILKIRREHERSSRETLQQPTD
jgi:hypothetical protein